MTNVRKFVISLSLIYFFFSFAGFSGQLDVYFFSVGQANFSLIKTSTHALVVDCGTKRKSEVHISNPHVSMKKKVRELLGSIKPIVLISHMDEDHYCGLNDFFPKDRRSKVVVGGIPSNTKQIPEDLSSGDVFFVENKQSGKVFNSKLKEQTDMSICALVKGAFGEAGDSPIVKFLLPAKNDSKDKNDQSIVVKIIYGGRSILLPGDAGSALLTSIETANPSCFRNIDVFSFAHHGSNGHAELTLLEKIAADRHIPTLGIISSKAGGASHIPRYFPDYSNEMAPGETFLRKVSGMSGLFPVVRPNAANIFCAYHTLSMYDTSIDAVYAAPAISKDGKYIIPVFCTGDLEANNLFYKVTISSDKTKLTMTDQLGKTLYQAVSGGGGLDRDISAPIKLAQEAISGVSEATKAALHEKLNTAETRIKQSVTTLSTAILSPSSPTVESIDQEITALKRIRKSKYLAKITVLERLSKVMRSIISNIELSTPLEKSRFLAEATGLWGLPLREMWDEPWAEFLWNSGFFATEQTPINSLANLLLAYINTLVISGQIPQTQIEGRASLASLTQAVALGMFRNVGRKVVEQKNGKKRVMSGDSLHSQLGIPSSGFLLWVEGNVRRILEASE